MVQGKVQGSVKKILRFVLKYRDQVFEGLAHDGIESVVLRLVVGFLIRDHERKALEIKNAALEFEIKVQ